MEKEQNNNEESFFTTQYTNVAKGIAILLMLIHHIGLDSVLSELQNSPFFISYLIKEKYVYLYF